MTKEAICKWLPGDDWQWKGEWAEEQPLIRCKDCKHWDGVDTCDVIDAPVWDNDFCSMAERKEE